MGMTRGGARAIALALLTGLVIAAPAADAKKADHLTLSAKTAGEGGEVKVSVRSLQHKPVAVEERLADSWHEVLRKRPDKRGRLRATASLVSTSGKVVLRARTRRASSSKFKLSLGEAAEPQPQPEPEVGVPVASDDPVGFNNNSVSQGIATADQSADLLAGVGADVDRVQIAWERLERSPGTYDFALADSVYAADLARGVRPLFILGYAPRWASGSACSGITGRCLAGPEPDYYDDFARAAAALATRYPEAAGIEIWNEPNLQHFWRPAANPEGYAALLRESYSAIKAANPAMSVGGGSVGQLNSDPGSLSAPEFLRRVFVAGAAGALDAITLHAYAGGDPTAERAVTDVANVRATRDAYGDPSKPLWVTETGGSTTGLGALSEVDQATRLTLLDTRLRSAPGVEMLIVHTLIDPPTDPGSRETGFGVVRPDFSKRPSYCALALAWAGSVAC